MHKRSVTRRATSPATLVVLAGLFSLALPVWAVAGQTKPVDGWALTTPKRRTADAPPAPPPTLPAAADAVAPATIELVIRRGSDPNAAALRQVVARTVDKIHLSGGDRREWLFERNPVDPRRVSASLIDHASQTIVIYQETDLRMSLGIRGWADVLSLGFDDRWLKGYRRTSDVRMIDGVRFSRYVPGTKDAGATDVWWSDEQALPSAFILPDAGGQRRFSVERIRGSVDPALLRAPEARFPNYRVHDFADWRERH